MLNKIKLGVMDIIPSSINPENQYAKSVAALLCLAVSADLDFDQNEFTNASIFIEQDEVLRSMDLTKRAVDYFTKYSKEIKTVMDSTNVDFPSYQTNLITEVRNVPSEFKPQMLNLISRVIQGCSPLELKTLNRIKL